MSDTTDKSVLLDLTIDNVCVTSASICYRPHDSPLHSQEGNAASRIIPFLAEYAAEPHGKPYQTLREMMSKVCEALGVEANGLLFVWRPNCGCDCGCKPGFKVLGSNAPRFDIYLKYCYL